MGSWDGDVYLIVEDSPVFATLFEYALRAFVGARGQVIRCNNYDEAAEHIYSGNVKVVVCGYGIGDGKTAHDLRSICSAPFVIMTGRPGAVEPPSSSVVLDKNAGPERLKAAVEASLA